MRWRVWLDRLVVLLVLLALWQVGSMVLGNYWLSTPWSTVTRFFAALFNGELVFHGGYTISEALAGCVIGGVPAVLLPFLLRRQPVIVAILDPFMVGGYGAPKLAFAPLFILWFGIGELPKVLLVALGVSFPLYLNTFSAIRQVDPKLFETAEVLGFSFWQRFHRIIVPSAAPQVLVGARQSLAIAWLTLIVAEQINADKGIGFLIMNARDFLRIDIIIFGLIVYALLGIGTDAIVRAFERRALRYRS